jgi:predicted MFS family arabinose efflux permease
MFQIPFGMASDAFGRKRVIVFGLVIFALGSAIAALSSSLEWIIVGRIVQGAGAISAAVTALAADLTREQHRTKVMALIGSSIGLVFALSLVAAPWMYSLIGMDGIFWTTAVLALAAIGLVTHVVPPPPPAVPGPSVPFREVLLDRQLMRLNFGIFTLHAVQMALFVVIPGLLVETGNLPLTSHWAVYLPTVLVSFVMMVPVIVFAERRNRVRLAFLGAIGLLTLTLLGLWLGRSHFSVITVGLLSFFVAFNILEAMLPSMISRIAPARAKGTALGVYNTTQAFGLFVGGALGGWLAKNFDPAAVFMCGAVMVLIWLIAAASMRPIPQRKLASQT